MSVIGKGDEEGLRHVEKDVLIPKKMKAKAMKLCHDTVKGTGIIKIIDYDAICDYLQSLRTV
jgi:hypothetical protein